MSPPKAALFLTEVHPPLIAERLVRQWGWKYDFNPFNQGREPLVFVLKAGSRIVGLQGLNFLRVSVAGNERWATQGCDLVVDSDYRKRALSRTLIKASLSCNPICISWTNAVSRKSVAPLSSASVGRLSFAVKPLDAKEILRSSAGGRMRRVLYRLGFGPWRIGSQGYFQARMNNAEPEAQVFKHIDQWYLTMGDGDLEMAF